MVNPWQINISKRDGHTRVVMTCWMLKDEGLPAAGGEYSYSRWRTSRTNQNIFFSISERASYLERLQQGGLVQDKNTRCAGIHVLKKYKNKVG